MTVDHHTRTRVYGPDEQREDDAFYGRKKGVAGHVPINMTTFRQAERFYRRRELASTWTELVDLRQPTTWVNKLRPVRQVHLYSDHPMLYELVGGGGLYIIPGILKLNQQLEWILEVLSQYMRPPNQCTLDAHYELPSEGLWMWWKELKENKSCRTLRRKPHRDDSVATQNLPLDMNVDPSVLKDLFRRMRWTTLGYQYDWTTKEYDFERDPASFPSKLTGWCAELVQAAGFGLFTAEAGIVNFYQPGDTLTGHVDRSERNMEVPLVSISLGAGCVFLVGGRDRNDPVTALKLESGDAIIMSGESRSFYHGVSCILDPIKVDASQLPDLPLDIQDALEILGDGRINVNIRQVQ